MKTMTKTTLEWLVTHTILNSISHPTPYSYKVRVVKYSSQDEPGTPTPTAKICFPALLRGAIYRFDFLVGSVFHKKNPSGRLLSGFGQLPRLSPKHQVQSPSVWPATYDPHGSHGETRLCPWSHGSNGCTTKAKLKIGSLKEPLKINIDHLKITKLKKKIIFQTSMTLGSIR